MRGAPPRAEGTRPGRPHPPSMCTLIVLHRCFADAPLLVAANRDEFLDRPAAPPALRRWGKRRALAALDLQAGGTWLGLNDAGLFAALTNRPCPAPDARRRSRGLLVSDLLGSATSAQAAAEALLALPKAAYNPFNLLVADGEHATAVIYEDAPHALPLAPGAHVIGNADPDCRAHPKTARLLGEAEAVAAGEPAQALSALAQLCRSHAESAAAPLAATCIHAAGYGTRCATLLRRGGPAAEERFLFADGPPCRTPFTDQTPLLTQLGRVAPAAPGAQSRMVA